jgi:SMODS and SLOG-associating 2TM effector domain 3/SMODS and SLOG-associating 2TM effector domain 1
MGGLKFTEKDYPALFLQADGASAGAQKKYLNFTRGTLILLVAGAALAAVSPALRSCKPAVATASAVVLAASVLLTAYLKTQKPEQLWYGGRAVAESTKSMTWRYMMGAAPYLCDLPSAEADRKFVLELKSIFKERKQLAFGFCGEFSGQPQITDCMRAVRLASLAERRAAYLAERVSDQRRWYGKQAKRNRSAENKYFNVIVISQLLAFIAAIALVRWPDSDIKLTGLFTCLASALIAWLQLKQHRELAQSYSIAELELGFIQEQAQHITTDADFSDFVGDAENAISREHTLWIARRAT